MSLAHQGLRKAALLVAGLDTVAADLVLGELSPEQARRVRDFIIELGEIDEDEQQRVIDEFLRVGPLVPGESPAGIELDSGLLSETLCPAGREEEGHVAASPPGDGAASRERARDFRFLQNVTTDKLARALAAERPQTIALVLSHLPSERSGAVLARLPGPLQAEVVRRLMDLQDTDPAVLRAVAEGLESRLAEQVEIERRRMAGTEAVAEMLAHAERETQTQILDSLAAHDPGLAEQFDAEPLGFEDLAGWDDEVVAEVFSKAPRELTVLALIGAPPELIERVLRQLPRAEATELADQLDHPGPLRLRDVEDARRQIARLARTTSTNRAGKPRGIALETLEV